MKYKWMKREERQDSRYCGSIACNIAVEGMLCNSLSRPLTYAFAWLMEMVCPKHEKKNHPKQYGLSVCGEVVVLPSLVT